MTAVKKMVEAKDILVINGHEVVLPKFTEEYSKMNNLDTVHNESVKNKVNHDLIRNYFKEINNCDAILVINEERHGIAGYIGGNSFLEMGFAHILNKQIFLLNPIPEIGYRDEIEAMIPIIINGDLSQIK